VGQAYDPPLIGQKTGNGLAYPPAGIGRKFDIPYMVVLFHGPYEAQVAFLYYIQKRNIRGEISTGDFYNQTQIGLYKPATGGCITILLDTAGELKFFFKSQKRNNPDLAKVGLKDIIRIITVILFGLHSYLRYLTIILAFSVPSFGSLLLNI
jgi:hypothetical protein